MDSLFFLAVPFNEELINTGLKTVLAISLYKEGILTLGKAAKLACHSVESFIEKLGNLGIAAVNYSASELTEELKGFA